MVRMQGHDLPPASTRPLRVRRASKILHIDPPPPAPRPPAMRVRHTSKILHIDPPSGATAPCHACAARQQDPAHLCAGLVGPAEDVAENVNDLADWTVRHTAAAVLAGREARRPVQPLGFMNL